MGSNNDWKENTDQAGGGNIGFAEEICETATSSLSSIQKSNRCLQPLKIFSSFSWKSFTSAESFLELCRKVSTTCRLETIKSKIDYSVYSSKKYKNFTWQENSAVIVEDLAGLSRGPFLLFCLSKDGPDGHRH